MIHIKTIYRVEPYAPNGSNQTVKLVFVAFPLVGTESSTICLDRVKPDGKIGICCFSAKHVAFSRKSKN